ncbi:hypothetical protein JXR93_10410 [bacterium]|nr:hypothetical protein [bacterium]
MRNNRLNRFLKGSALVEFSLVSTVMIPILLYSQYFSEAIHVQYKANEANYYAAWSLTGYQLTDYSVNMNSSRKSRYQSNLNAAITNIQTDIQNRYSNFDSADPNGNSRTIMITPTMEQLVMKKKAANFLPVANPSAGQDSSDGSGAGTNMFSEILSTLNNGVQWVMGDLFYFNVDNAGATSQIGVNYVTRDSFKNAKKYLSKDNSGGFFAKDLTSDEMDNGLTFKTREFSVLVDAWRLEDGSDVDVRNQASNKPYVKQVQGMMWFGLVNKLIGLFGNVDTSTITDWLPGGGGAFDTPFNARVISKNTVEIVDGAGNNKVDNKNDQDAGTSQRYYMTNPIWHDGFKATNGYVETIQKRRGFYLGNGKEQCNHTERCEP